MSDTYVYIPSGSHDPLCPAIHTCNCELCDPYCACDILAQARSEGAAARGEDSAKCDLEPSQTVSRQECDGPCVRKGQFDAQCACMSSEAVNGNNDHASPVYAHDAASVTAPTGRSVTAPTGRSVAHSIRCSDGE